ncbi:aminopeptidase O [Chanos chanos]|uniref:Aminopeptidase O n=1 Tax=Chanos chanos TaxID=29144 RepID=A0A6J2W6T7_CHACN|nr:aminopeptidase O [Chanos chanos]
MERDVVQSDLDPQKDDLPLLSNTNHMLVRHYVLDLSVYFQRKVVSGSIVLFLEPFLIGSPESQVSPASHKGQDSTLSASNLLDKVAVGVPRDAPHQDEESISGDVQFYKSEDLLWKEESDDFTLVLDCCDLHVSRVEEVDVTSVSDMRGLLEGCEVDLDKGDLSSDLVQRLVSLPSASWRQQHSLYRQCSCAPAPLGVHPLLFHVDKWSLNIRKIGTRSPLSFPRAIRIYYETKPTGGSVRWTKDQDNRCCVYTMGSPINNRALFPCQEPPIAMSTWQAQIKARSEFVVLLSGENQAKPSEAEPGFYLWDYYVTMPMPASTFSLAVGHWLEARTKSTNPCSESGLTGQDCEANAPSDVHRLNVCSHMDYPCRFALGTATAQAVIPHRVFAPSCLLLSAEATVLHLLPGCLAAAHSVLGVHPFSRLDVLIVPSGFSSLGMASPHIIFLSQSVLSGEKHLCGARLCHEIAHSWFGLAIGARDWTEEWISEGFATYLEDVFWARVQQLGSDEAQELGKLKALLRWRRLHDELQNSEEELQVLRPNKENTGEVSESGASVVKHALNPGKPFMQVHYLKGYFLLKFLAGEVGEESFLDFFRLFVKKYHGHLVLSQDFLQMYLNTFPALKRKGLSLDVIYSDWLDTPAISKWLFERSAVWAQTSLVKEVKEEVAKWIQFSCCCGKGSKRKRAGPKVIFKEVSPEQLVLLLEFLLEESDLGAATLRLLEKTYNLQAQDAEVKHRWCELVVKHKYTPAYGDVERFLIHDQAMGVYLYGELMLYEDPRQQALARRCLELTQDEMDQSARSVVREMIL